MIGAPAQNRMCVSVTSGLPAKRASVEASVTTKTSDCRMACALKEISRGAASIEMPIRALNHSRSLATKLISATGASQRRAASVARSSNGTRVAYRERHTA